MKARTITELTRITREGHVADRRAAREELATRSCYCGELDPRGATPTAFECACCRAAR